MVNDRQWGNDRQLGITDNGEWHAMVSDRQWEMTDNGRLTDNWELHIMGNDRQWGMTCNREWQTIGNDKQWGMADNWKWQTMGNGRQLEMMDGHLFEPLPVTTKITLRSLNDLPPIAISCETNMFMDDTDCPEELETNFKSDPHLLRYISILYQIA